MAKLWQKDVQLDSEIEAFTVGNDYILDMELVEADVLGNIAHSQMLAAIGILTQEEFAQVKQGLREVLELHRKGEFKIEPSQEDVHTAVEEYLTVKLGDLGKKIHTGRSRNDQVMVDTRIYTRDLLHQIMLHTLLLADTLADFGHRYRDVPMPGRTHTQRAMPSSVGLWAGAFAESLMDDYRLLQTAAELNDQCPLGSAASYGVALPLDRQMTSDLLGFRKVQNNVLYANNSRGKIEAIVLFALVEITHDLAKLSNDIIFFSIPELGYFILPEKYCPGSSIMPQKKNPDHFELIRGKSAAVEAALFRILNITRALPSGYNRDFQETKEPLMQGLHVTLASLKIARPIFADLGVNEERMVASFTSELFAADVALDMAAKGIPFRDAYREIGLNLDNLDNQDPRANIKSKTHLGAPGNLGIEALRCKIAAERENLDAEQQHIEDCKRRLIS